MNISTKNTAVIAAIVLSLGILMNRKASAATVRTTSSTSPQGQAIRYSISPGTALQQGAGLKTGSTSGGTMSSVLNLGTTLLNTFNPNRVASGPYGDYYPGHMSQVQSAEADGTIGEGAAQAFYNANKDLFTTPDPVITDDMTARALAEGLSEY